MQKKLASASFPNFHNVRKHQWNEKSLLWTGRPACALWQLYYNVSSAPEIYYKVAH